MHASNSIGFHPRLRAPSAFAQCRHRGRSSLSAASRLASLEPAPTSTTGPAPPPPRTVSEAVRQARMSLRLYREAAAAEAAAAAGAVGVTATASSSGDGEGDGAAATEAQRRSGGATSTSASPGSGSGSGSGSEIEPGSGSTGPRRLIVELPLPSQRVGFLGRGAPQPDLLMLLDEGDYPGGEVQRFRVLRKLVEALLEGYDAEFLGFLEDGADGVGLWSCGRDMTLIANVTNATVPSLVKLFDGGYGSRVTRPGHSVVAVNPQWTDAGSVGQPWQWRLRQRAAEVLDESRWTTLYSARMLRGSRGANGLLTRAWPHRWALYPAATPDARHLGECLLATPARPPADVILARLNEAKPEMQKKAKELGLDEPGWF